jgi:RNA-directed DNA polymerase
MCASDVTAKLDQGLAASDLDNSAVVHRPRLLSDNGTFYIEGDLADWLETRAFSMRGRILSPTTPGQERALARDPEEPESYWKTITSPDTDRQIGAFAEHRNHVRYHESIENVTPPTFTSAAQTILAECRH